MKEQVLILILLSACAFAQFDSCPYGLVNDTYPGECPRYIDTNQDDICDRSQTAPTTSTTLPGQEAPSIESARGNDPPLDRYNVTAITLGAIALYTLTWALSRKKRITVLAHRRLWNTVLLLSFIVCGLTGMVFAVNLSFGWNIRLPNASFLHIETGIAMTLVALFHVLWHIPYYAAMLKKKSKE